MSSMKFVFLVVAILYQGIKASILIDGGYRIRCQTLNGGARCLEAFPREDAVSKTCICNVFKLTNSL